MQSLGGLFSARVMFFDDDKETEKVAKSLQHRSVKFVIRQSASQNLLEAASELSKKTGATNAS